MYPPTGLVKPDLLFSSFYVFGLSLHCHEILVRRTCPAFQYSSDIVKFYGPLEPLIPFITCDYKYCITLKFC